MSRTMIERTNTDEDETRSVLRRRSLIAGVGVLAAGLLATKSAETVRASDGALQLGGPNTPTAQTQLSASLDAQNPILHLSATGAGSGIESYGDGTGVGVLGYAVQNDGVSGTTAIADGTHAGVKGFAAAGGNGVIGQCDSNITSYGVYGKSDIGVAVRGQSSVSGMGVFGTSNSSSGVVGQSTSGIGVRGTIPIASSAAGTIAVYGENMSSNTGGVPGNGGFGAYGYSAKGHGLVGATGTAGGGAVVGSANGIAGAYAAIFYGPIAVEGAAKSAAVKNADGSHSLLYCVESPESWFEDFGTGQLVGGKAQVKIDPAFAAVADLSEHHVFLTAYGNTNGLHVTDRSAQGFTVEEHNGGKNSLTFSYRIVGKRKDIEGKRLAKVNLPTEPTRSATMSAPALPSAKKP